MAWLSEGITALISGMSAVFLILIMISAMISMLGRFGQRGKLEKKAVIKTEVHTSKLVDTPTVNEEDEQRRIVAAITVALAQNLGLSQDQLIIRKFRRL